MSETFFTADTHFGHSGLIAHGYRPDFSSVEEMDEALIERWNRTVSKADVVWHLGDFTLSGAEVAERYLDRLNGKIHLIWGNHDRNSVRKLGRWASSQYATEINLDGHKITLCHYAMRVWNRCHHGALMLHGHSHGGLPVNSQSADVGVDVWGFHPVRLPTVIQWMASFPAFQAQDHHQ